MAATSITISIPEAMYADFVEAACIQGRFARDPKSPEPLEKQREAFAGQFLLKWGASVIQTHKASQARAALALQVQEAAEAGALKVAKAV